MGKYQCNLPLNERHNKVACFCGFLQDREYGNSVLNQQTHQRQQSQAACLGGLAAGFPCQAVDLQSHMDLTALGGTASVNDIWGWTNPMGQEFALIGLAEGTGFVDITDAAKPVYLGLLPTATVSSWWRDIKTYQNYAYIVSEASSHGMQVFDLTVLSQVTAPPVEFNATARYTELSEAHNVVINEDSGYAYVVGANTCSGGLHMIDLSTPSQPQFVGCYSGDGYVHDAHCVMYMGADVDFANREICFCSNEDTITIVDVTDKSQPVQLPRTLYGSTGYTHQGWLSDDQKYLIFGDETDEQSNGFNTKTLVMDVQSLTNPSLAGFYLGPTKAIDHNLYNKDGYTYLASYRAGMRVLKIHNLATASFSEIGFFDIYPGSDTANFNGAWSVYPFFASGNVIISGIEQGLFVVTPDLTAPSGSEPPSEAPSASPSEAPSNSPSAAPSASTALPVCNNNGVCDAGEDCNNCGSDCASKTTGNPRENYCCDGDLSVCGNPRCVCGSGQTFQFTSGSRRAKIHIFLTVSTMMAFFYV